MIKRLQRLLQSRESVAVSLHVQRVQHAGGDQHHRIFVSEIQLHCMRWLLCRAQAQRATGGSHPFNLLAAPAQQVIRTETEEREVPSAILDPHQPDT